MDYSTSITDLVNISAFGGALISFTILVKNKRKTHWSIAISILALSVLLVCSAFFQTSTHSPLILLAALIVPLFSNIYFYSLFNPSSPMPVSSLIFNLVLGSVLIYAAIYSSNHVRPIILASCAFGVIGMMFLQRKLVVNLEAKSVRRTWIQVVSVLLISYYINLIMAVVDLNMTITILQIGLALLVLSLVIALMLMPTYLYEEAMMSSSESVVGNLLKARSNKKFELTEEVQHQYIDRIVSYMENEEPFLNQGFTLNNLAQNLELSPTYTSRVINKIYRKNFRDFVNTYRIKKACKHLRHDKMKNFTIEAIASESGFHSRTSFYNAFKKVMKISPGEYMTKQRETVIV